MTQSSGQADLWAAFGFSQNPYSPLPVPATIVGDTLLVGRDAEVAEVTARLSAGSMIPVLVGANGVGKTSIVSVATYRLSRIRNVGGPVYLTLDEPLQLDPTTSVEQFVQDVYYRVAKVLLKEEKLLTQHGVRKRKIAAFRRWLNEPETRQRGFGLSTPVGGGSVQTGGMPNEAGFRDGGMRTMVEDWLGLCFPEAEKGGIVCSIDNLELLRTSAKARETLEALRDGLLAKPGLRWVLCGTPIVLGGGALNSARMEGRIAVPTYIQPVEAALVPELIARRIRHYGSPEAYAPVDGQGLECLYAVVHSRLRSALDLCQEFALFLHLQERRPDPEGRLQMLSVWLAEQANRFTPRRPPLSAPSWRLFDDLGDIGGELRGKESQILGYPRTEDLVAAASSLHYAGLVERVDMDDGDFVLQVTTRGWLVRYQRRDYSV